MTSATAKPRLCARVVALLTAPAAALAGGVVPGAMTAGDIPSAQGKADHLIPKAKKQAVEEATA